MDPLGTPRSLRLALVGTEPARNAADETFERMLDGWRAQQLSRNLSFATIDAGGRVVRRFQEHARSYPWEWSPGDLQSWVAHLRSDDGRAHSTVRNYELSVASFLAYACNPAYGWDVTCLASFASHPVQICDRSNLAVHASEQEARPARRPLTKSECQDLFDAADARTESIRANGHKGWVPAFRDATMLKVAYAWGLRRRELLMLEVADFAANPKAPEFGDYGVCRVRFGKAANGSPPRRRGVLTVMDWSAEVIAEWVEEILPAWRPDSHGALWPSERHPRVSEDRLNAAFGAAAADAGLPDGLSPHCLRHAYVTHLVEDGFDALFVQQQVGHQHSSTTALYTAVSSDYRTRVLRAALDNAVGATSREEGQEP